MLVTEKQLQVEGHLMGKDGHFPQVIAFSIRPLPCLVGATESATSAFDFCSLTSKGVTRRDGQDTLNFSKNFCTCHLNMHMKNEMNNPRTIVPGYNKEVIKYWQF